MIQGKDWTVTAGGEYEACKPVRTWNLLRQDYRLYRFLTELEDVLNEAQDQCSCLPAIRMLVRKLIINSYWVQSQYSQPDEQTGSSVLILYDELGFPLTVQTVTFAPGTRSTIHNHGTWGVIALLKGKEKNTFWQRDSGVEGELKVIPTGEIYLSPGDVISLTPDAIHSVEAMGDEPTVTFNIYGETNPQERFEFDLVAQTAKKF